MAAALAVALDVAANLASAAIYLSVARIVAGRAVDPQAILARRAFATFWGVLGSLSLYGVLADLLTATGTWTLPLLLTLTHGLLLLLLVAVAGLLYYLVYVYTGKQDSWKAIAAFYFLFWVGLVYLVTWAHPIGVDTTGPSGTHLTFKHDLTGTPLSTALGLLLVVPILGGAIAYFTLFFKAREPTQRYRIGVVSLSLVVWFGLSLVGTLAGLSQAPVWLAFSRLVSFLAAACIYWAYRPPLWVQRRWRIEGAGAVSLPT